MERYQQYGCSQPVITHRGKSIELSDRTVHRKLDNETVLLNLDNGQYYSINELGTRVWNAIPEDQSTEELVDTLLQEYEVSPEQLRADIDELIDGLIKNGLIQYVA